jgi:DNA mismatch endonuclease (patch repair protein)
MSQIKGRDTRVEIVLRKSLWRRGLRDRIATSLPGKPDLVFPRNKVAIFVDGCFWHRCAEHYSKPKTNVEFWEKKITGNVARDDEVNELLAADGWTVIRIWEHAIKHDLESSINKILKAVR